MDIKLSIQDRRLHCRVNAETPHDCLDMVFDVNGDPSVTIQFHPEGKTEISSPRAEDDLLALVREAVNDALCAAERAEKVADEAIAAAEDAAETADSVAADREMLEMLVDQILTHRVSWDEITGKPTTFPSEVQC